MKKGLKNMDKIDYSYCDIVVGLKGGGSMVFQHLKLSPWQVISRLEFYGKLRDEIDVLEYRPKEK
jgi:hypothetical protein